MRAIPIAIFATMLAGGSGCATTERPLAAVHDPDIDHEKVIAVEQAARERGVQVMWLQYPRKRSPE